MNHSRAAASATTAANITSCVAPLVEQSQTATISCSD